MEIREERAGDVLVLLPDGDLSTGEDCRALEQNLARVLSGGTLLVVLDFSRVGRLTSPALRALLLASRKLARAKGRLVLCGMTAKVQKAFSLSGFDRDFSVVAEREAAVLRALEPVAVFVCLLNGQGSDPGRFFLLKCSWKDRRKASSYCGTKTSIAIIKFNCHIVHSCE